MKLTINHILLTCSVLAMSSCGVYIYDGEDEEKEEEAYDPPTSELFDSLPPNAPVEFRGYVTSAFAVTVDDQDYADMEDFYTQELNRLPEKLAAAGYDDSWDVELDAELGFSDLWNHMRVYIAPMAPQGFQAETQVTEGGKFRVRLPHEAVGHSYRVRANKRINIILRRGEEVIKTCYNFSATEQQVELADEALPIVLANFYTRITRYDCSLSEGGGLEVPASDETPTTLPTPTPEPEV